MPRKVKYQTARCKTRTYRFGVRKNDRWVKRGRFYTDIPLSRAKRELQSYFTYQGKVYLKDQEELKEKQRKKKAGKSS